MSGTLDDAFANIIALGQPSDAYTTGTANNQALLSAVQAVVVTLKSGQTTADEALTANELASPADVLSAGDAAGYLAGSTAALAWLTQQLAVLARP